MKKICTLQLPWRIIYLAQPQTLLPPDRLWDLPWFNVIKWLIMWPQWELEMVPKGASECSTLMAHTFLKMYLSHIYFNRKSNYFVCTVPCLPLFFFLLYEENNKGSMAFRGIRWLMWKAVLLAPSDLVPDICVMIMATPSYTLQPKQLHSKEKARGRWITSVN